MVRLPQNLVPERMGGIGFAVEQPPGRLAAARSRQFSPGRAQAFIDGVDRQAEVAGHGLGVAAADRRRVCLSFSVSVRQPSDIRSPLDRATPALLGSDRLPFPPEKFVCPQGRGVLHRTTMTAHSAAPMKRSMMIAGHATSVSLEPVFWDACGRGGSGGPAAERARRADRRGADAGRRRQSRQRDPRLAVRTGARLLASPSCRWGGGPPIWRWRGRRRGLSVTPPPRYTGSPSPVADLGRKASARAAPAPGWRSGRASGRW